LSDLVLKGETSMSFCEACGKQMDDEFCPRCGWTEEQPRLERLSSVGLPRRREFVLAGVLSTLASLASVTGISLHNIWQFATQGGALHTHLVLTPPRVIAFVLFALIAAASILTLVNDHRHGYSMIREDLIIEAEGSSFRHKFYLTAIGGSCTKCDSEVHLRRVAVGTKNVMDSEGDVRTETIYEARLICRRYHKIHQFAFDPSRNLPLLSGLKPSTAL